MWRLDDASENVRIDDISVSSVPIVVKTGNEEEEQDKRHKQRRRTVATK